MVNYQLGKVYKIVDNTNGKIYIGSTCSLYLSIRLAGHNNNYKRYLNGLQGNMTSSELIKNGDYDIVLIEECKCDNKMQLYARERHYIDLLECVNKQKPNQTQKEYNEIHKDEIKSYKKEYYETNKDKINEQKKIYRDLNKDKINARKREIAKLKREMNIVA